MAVHQKVPRLLICRWGKLDNVAGLLHRDRDLLFRHVSLKAMQPSLSTVYRTSEEVGFYVRINRRQTAKLFGCRKLYGMKKISINVIERFSSTHSDDSAV